MSQSANLNRMTTSLETVIARGIYTPEELSLIDIHSVPKHIAIIMDGNRRWAKKRGLPPPVGHWEGAEVLTEVVRGASELGVKTLTTYAFSTENWGREDGEVEDLMNIFELYLVSKREEMIQDGVRLNAIGDLSKMPEKVQKAFIETKQATAHSDKINLVLALNYGGRDEIKRAVQKMMVAGIAASEVTEETIAQYLDTNAFGDPDLLIRTSGEMRLSNFLLWQSSYAELVSTDVMWPDFSPKALLLAIAEFQRRHRRVGL